MEPPEFDRRVLAAIAPTLDRVTLADLSRRTPCADWTLGDLVAHMVGHHRGFAAAAHGAAPDPAVWDEAQLGADPARTYRTAADALTEAFGHPDLMDRKLAVHQYGTHAARIALNMHSVDFLGHGWDVARSLGIDDRLPDDLCEHALTIAARWPDTSQTWGTGPGVPFGPHLTVPGDAPAYQRLMGFLGRNPQWTVS